MPTPSAQAGERAGPLAADEGASVKRWLEEERRDTTTAAEGREGETE
jgi:hypothetical protein